MTRHTRYLVFITAAPLVFLLWGGLVAGAIDVDWIAIPLILAPVVLLAIKGRPITCRLIGHDFERIQSAIGPIDFCHCCGVGYVKMGEGDGA